MNGWKDLRSRLLQRFGLGELPVARRRLYARLEREVEQHGEGPHRIISEVALEADRARDRGRYFCCAVTRRLKEAGYLVNDRGVTTNSGNASSASDLAREFAGRADPANVDRLA